MSSGSHFSNESWAGCACSSRLASAEVTCISQGVWGSRGSAAAGTRWTLLGQDLEAPQNRSVCKGDSMTQECHQEPHVPRADGRKPTLLAGGATRRRCCQVAVASGQETRSLQVLAGGFCTLCVLFRNLHLPPVLRRVTLLRAQHTLQSLLGIYQPCAKISGSMHGICSYRKCLSPGELAAGLRYSGCARNVDGAHGGCRSRNVSPRLGKGDRAPGFSTCLPAPQPQSALSSSR